MKKFNVLLISMIVTILSCDASNDTTKRNAFLLIGSSKPTTNIETTSSSSSSGTPTVATSSSSSSSSSTSGISDGIDTCPACPTCPPVVTCPICPTCPVIGTITITDTGYSNGGYGGPGEQLYNNIIIGFTPYLYIVCNSTIDFTKTEIYLYNLSTNSNNVLKIYKRSYNGLTENAIMITDPAYDGSPIHPGTYILSATIIGTNGGFVVLSSRKLTIL